MINRFPLSHADGRPHFKITSVCLPRHPAVAYLFLVRSSRPPDGQRITALLGEGAYEHCWTSFDWLRGAACFARRSWLRSAQTSVVRVERRADTPGDSRKHYRARARCILRSAVGPVAPAWRVTAERAAQRRGTASRHARLAHPLCNHCGRQHASDGGRDSVRADRSSGRATPCHRVGARHDGLAAEMHAVAFLGAERGHPWARRIVMAGWVVVETDYSFAEKGGPHPYLIGEGEARAALDSVRAARQMSELALDQRIVVWGYSQGGHAALWTGIVGPRYAPDLEILGVAAIAPAANIKNILAMNIAVDKRFGPYIALAYSRFYPEITFEQALRPEALDAARQIVNLCDFVPTKD